MPARAVGLAFGERPPIVVRLEGDERLLTRGVLIATGAKYRKLSAEGCERFEGLGVHYAATKAEAQRYAGAEVAVVGAGHAAGQAAAFLSAHAKRVYLLLRGARLLFAEIVARESEHVERLSLHLALQSFEPFVLRREAAIARDVHDQAHLAAIHAEISRFATRSAPLSSRRRG